MGTHNIRVSDAPVQCWRFSCDRGQALRIRGTQSLYQRKRPHYAATTMRTSLFAAYVLIMQEMAELQVLGDVKSLKLCSSSTYF